MTGVVVVGGLYHERCVWPHWDQVYGSGGRAAVALSRLSPGVILHTYATPELLNSFEPYAAQYGITANYYRAEQVIRFDYFHNLSTPAITPDPRLVRSSTPIEVTGDVVLRFGMLEGDARVAANICIYDPQSPVSPQSFGSNGSVAERLAIVGNRSEITLLAGQSDPVAAARALLKSDDAEVVVVKAGAAGATVVQRSRADHIPAVRTDRAWTIGSGDVFAAAFAAAWGLEGQGPVPAARFAALATARYADSMALPIPLRAELESMAYAPAPQGPARIYLAGPFFTISQRWLVDEVRRHLLTTGVEVFSPVHEIGDGPAAMVAPADVRGLESCDSVFAILDGCDSGTLFEVGYARAQGKAVVALAQNVTEAQLKMVEGTGCRVFDDLASAIYQAAWTR